MEHFECICSCGKYQTACDMPKSIAIKAAEMHVMLDGDHKVQIRGEGAVSRCAVVTKENGVMHV